MSIIDFPSRSWLSFQVLTTASFLLLLAIAPAANGVSAPASSGSNLQWLRVDGHSIVREDGAIMILRGANLPPLTRSSVTPARYGVYLDVAKSMGYNVIRLPVSWAELEPLSGRFSSTYLDSIKKIVDLAGERKMYVVVDMHQFKIDGFPAWALPKLKSSDEAAAGFWHSSTRQLELVKAWKTLASLLKDRSMVAGYDLLNEPYGGTMTWQNFAPILNEFYSKLISEIRSVDARHIIFFEPTEGECILGQHIALRPLGMNLAFSPHFYVSGSVHYLDYVAQQLYNLTVSTWNVPLWIGEFGGTTVEVSDRDSLDNLVSMLDLFDRYGLGWAYWILADDDSGPRMVDGNGQGSALLTSIMTRIFPTSYTVNDLAFSYNNTPRFQLRAVANSDGSVEVSAPTPFRSMVLRCIDCVSTGEEGQQTLMIEIPSNKTAYFYLDTPESISRLNKLAELEFDQALRISEKLKLIAFHSTIGRKYVREITELITSMQANLTVKHYEFVLGKLDRVTQLHALAVQEEEKYTYTKEFVDSIRQDIMASQDHLTKWQSVLISQAYESLDEGNYTSAVEWGKQARDLPREIPRDSLDAYLQTMLWGASLALLGIVLALIVFRSFSYRSA